jgi:hypothetical protein
MPKKKKKKKTKTKTVIVALSAALLAIWIGSCPRWGITRLKAYAIPVPGVSRAQGLECSDGSSPCTITMYSIETETLGRGAMFEVFPGDQPKQVELTGRPFALGDKLSCDETLPLFGVAWPSWKSECRAKLTALGLRPSRILGRSIASVRLYKSVKYAAVVSASGHVGSIIPFTGSTSIGATYYQVFELPEGSEVARFMIDGLDGPQRVCWSNSPRFLMVTSNGGKVAVVDLDEIALDGPRKWRE